MNEKGGERVMLKIWVVSGGVFMLIAIFILYCCIVVGAKAEIKMEQLARKIG